VPHSHHRDIILVNITSTLGPDEVDPYLTIDNELPSQDAELHLERLQQVAKLLHLVCLIIREEAFPIGPANAYYDKVTNEFYIVLDFTGEESNDFKYVKCPQAILDLQHHRETALMVNACSDAALMLVPFAKALLRRMYHPCVTNKINPISLTHSLSDSSVSVEEVAFKIKNRKHALAWKYPGRTRHIDCEHEVMKVTLADGTAWCIDVTGEQFGFTEILFKWSEYEFNYIQKIRVWHGSLARIDNLIKDGEPRIKLQALQLSELAQRLEVYWTASKDDWPLLLNGVNTNGNVHVRRFLDGLRAILAETVLSMNEDENRAVRKALVKQMIRDDVLRGVTAYESYLQPEESGEGGAE
jgi:hypothetical protein